MKLTKYTYLITLMTSFGVITGCDDSLNERLENVVLVENTDYTQTDDMDQLLTGAYGTFYNLQWETFPLISVRGDDVNAAGDQAPLTGTDEYMYDRSYWMYNSTWLNLYSDIISFNASIEELLKYKEFATDPSEADQYIAEIQVLIGYEMLQLSRLWGDVLIPMTSQPDDLYTASLSSKDEVMQYISDLMDSAIPNLEILHPNQRVDIPGGVTIYTALAVKALVNLELKNYQGVADATSDIISSNVFALESDYYNLFKIPGKLNDENILELQYSDFGQGSGENRNYLNAFFGPQGWTPAVSGASSGWGFYEPSVKYIKFMLDRGEQMRLETSVLFTNAGIAEIQSDPSYATLPSWISNTTRDGDVINDYARANFASGKHYLPSNQLIDGRTSYGSNKNFMCIRYSEILLIHAEALTQGATSSAMTADGAVNAVRSRAGLADISGATLDVVLDEKYAELAMEWGTRFYDLVRHERTSELNYGGRTYDAGDRYIPYPLAQLDLLPQLNVGE